MFGEIHGEKFMENNLRTFISHIGRSGIAKKDRYVVEIFGPGGMPVSTKTVNLMCESISFPGQNIRSVPDTLRYGPAREHGQGITFGPFTAQFICSSDMREKKYFEWWQSQIINYRWEPNYYDNYKGSLQITQLGNMDQTMYAIEVFEAYPKTIMPQDMGYAQNNAYHTLGIEFTYRYWNPQIIEAPVNVDSFDAFSGGRGARETRAVDDFGFSGGHDPFASSVNRGDDFSIGRGNTRGAEMTAVDRMGGFSGGRGLTQFRETDNMDAFSGGRGLTQYRASDGLEGFSGGRGLTQFRMYD